MKAMTHFDGKRKIGFSHVGANFFSPNGPLFEQAVMDAHYQRNGLEKSTRRGENQSVQHLEEIPHQSRSSRTLARKRLLCKRQIISNIRFSIRNTNISMLCAILVNFTSTLSKSHPWSKPGLKWLNLNRNGDFSLVTGKRELAPFKYLHEYEQSFPFIWA